MPKTLPEFNDWIAAFIRLKINTRLDEKPRVLLDAEIRSIGAQLDRCQPDRKCIDAANEIICGPLL